MFTRLSTEQILIFLDALPYAAICLEDDYKIKFVNKTAQKYFSKNPKIFLNNKIYVCVEDARRSQTRKVYDLKVNDYYCKFYFEPVHFDEHADLIIVYADLENKTQTNYELYKEESEDLKALFETAFDVMYVSDQEGNTLRVSAAAEEFWGENAKGLIGRNVIELEKLGVFKPSITRMVLESKEKVTAVQTTQQNKRLLVTGAPIKDEHGEVIRVVNASRDITEVEKLQREVLELKNVLEEYQLEIAQMQQSIQEDNKIVYQSKLMSDSMDLAKRLAKVNSTVLITGESGVGKELVANYIHAQSLRSNKPIVKINCSAIPENLLEYELFGSNQGLFGSQSNEVKIGMFEFANEGTLYLDEISDISYALQTKLLRVLQEQEIRRIGSTETIKLDVRIIASSNKDLYELVKENKFREDLYYRLNVVPLHIAPLRERIEDIAPLSNHFIQRYNKKYGTNKRLSSKAIYYLEMYNWPGNVRELQNIIERAVVVMDQEAILDEIISLVPTSDRVNEDIVTISKIIPLKECIELAEKKLLQMALDKYNSTTEIAKVLEVNQSTISRKLLKKDKNI